MLDKTQWGTASTNMGTPCKGCCSEHFMLSPYLFFKVSPILRIALLLGAILLVIPSSLLAQEATGLLSGKVLVQGSRAPVEYAQVSLKGPHGAAPITKMTDGAGSFLFTDLAPGAYTISVTEDTIEPITDQVEIKPGKKTKKNCYVRVHAYLLDEVTVVGEQEPEAISRQKLSKEELTGVPGANNDAIRVVENLPGVAATSVAGFGNEGLVIRGTSAEDSGYKLNGFDIPQLFHFGGATSIVNSELIDDIVYYPGAYSAKYGDALGGIVEITSRKPRTDRFGGMIDLNNYASFALFEGPIGKKGGMAGAVRRSFIDFILPYVVPEDELDITVMPRYYDFQGIFTYDFTSAHSLTIGTYGADDAMGLIAEPELEEPFDKNTFNMRTAWQQANAAWDFHPNDKLSNRLAVNVHNEYTMAYFNGDNKIKISAVVPEMRDDYSIRLADWNELRMGVQGAWIVGDIEADVPQAPKEGQVDGVDAAENLYHIDITDDYWLVGGYIEDLIQPAKWVQLVPGFRFEYHDYIKQALYDPRLGVKFHPTESSAIKAATGFYHQWPKLDEFVEDYGNPDLEPERATLGSLGFEYDFGQGYNIDLQGYYKDLSNLVSSTGDEGLYDNDGKGYVYGAEFLARKELTDRLFGWVSYTYSVSKRKDQPGDDWRYFDQDQTHNFIILASYKLGKRKDWRIGGKWQYSTGLPYTGVSDAIYNADFDTYMPIYDDEINGERNDDFHKLDLRVDKLWVFNAWSLNTYLDLQNVYWNKYPIEREYNYDYTESRMISFPPFMATVGLQAQF